MVSAEAPTRRCQNSQMKDLVVFETHCRYFAMLFLEVIQVHILSSSLSFFIIILSFLLFLEKRLWRGTESLGLGEPRL